jgi:hypothetical protein
LNLAVVIKSAPIQCQLEFYEKKNSHEALHLGSTEGVTQVMPFVARSPCTDKAQQAEETP